MRVTQFIVTLFLMAVPTGLFSQELPKTKNQSAREVDYISIENLGKAEQFLVLVMEGLVNRSRPRIYVEDRLYEGGQDAELRGELREWWREYYETFGYVFEDFDDYRALVKKHSHKFGVIIYDEDCWTDEAKASVINELNTSCGLMNALPFTRRLAGEFGIDPLTTGTAKPGKVARKVIAHRHPWSMYLTDYIAAQNAECIWVTKSHFNNEQGKRNYETVLREATDPNAAVLGCWQSWWPKAAPGSILEGLGELDLLTFFSDHGRFFVPVVSPGNLTYHSGFDERELKQKPPAKRTLEQDKTYVTFILSDGDNVSGFMQIRPKLWNDPARGRIPIGWTFSPAMSSLCPQILKQFYETASPNDYFVTGCSGLGYVRAGYASNEADPKSTLAGYLKMTAKAMERCDSRIAWNWWMDEKMHGAFARSVPLEAIFAEPEPLDAPYEKSFSTAPNKDGGKVPIFHNFASAGIGLKSGQMMDEWAERIKKMAASGVSPKFLFLGFNGFEASPTRLDVFLKKLGDRFIAVRPDEFVELYKETLK